MRKQFILLLITGLISVSLTAQENRLHIKAGKTFSTFLFRNSEKNKDETLSMVSRTILGLSYDVAVKELSIIRGEISYREMGARSAVNQQKLEWNFNYLDLNAAYILKIYRKEKVTVYQGIGPYAAFLVSGDQQLGDSYYNIIETETIKRLDYGLNFFAGGMFTLSENTALTLEYRYGLGLAQIESNVAETDQITRNRSHGPLVGFMFNF